MSGRLLLVFGIFFLLHNPLHAQTITISCANPTAAYDEIVQIMPQPFKLEQLTYEADIPFAAEEFFYLVGFKRGDVVTSSLVQQAVSHLCKKNKFNEIVLTINGKKRELHFVCMSLWTVKKVVVKGIWRGKDLYRQLYLMEPGEVFDHNKHAHSLIRIKDTFAQEGYLHAEIRDALVFDQRTKTITINLDIKHGKAFKIDAVSIAYVNGDLSPELQERLCHQAQKTLVHQTYQQPLLNAYGKQVKELLRQAGYLQAKVSLQEILQHDRHQVDLAITINVGKANYFEFNGAHFFSEHQLLEMILSFGQSTWLLPSSILAEEIEQAYRKKGFWQAQVYADEDDTNYVFTIEEGNRAQIKNIQLLGATTFTPSSLVPRYFSSFLSAKDNFFDEDKLAQSLESLLAFYRQEGFWEATIISYEVVDSVLIIHLDEGERHYLDHIEVPGFPDYEKEGPIAAYNNQKEPTPFNVLCIPEQRQWLLQQLHEQGYIYAEISHEIIDNVLIWHIVSHEKLHFGKTIIAGAHHLPVTTLVKELPYKEGEVWDKRKLDQALKRLHELGLGQAVYIYPLQIATPESYKPIMIKIVEDEPFEIRARGGVLGISKNLTWRNEATYKVGGTFIYKNPFNSPGLLALDGDVTRFERRISGQYQTPWFFGFPYKTLLKAYSNRYIQPVVIGNKEPLYTALQQGFLVGLTTRKRALTFGMTAGFEVLETELKSRNAAHAIDFLPRLDEVKVPYFFTEPTVIVDYLNDQLNPTKGTFTLGSGKIMLPLKPVTPFFKVLLEQSFFYPLHEFAHAPNALQSGFTTLILALRIRAGHIFNRQFNQIMPTDRFYLGGPYSLRGYDLDHAPPLGCYTDCDGKKRLVPQGGRSMLNMNLELRFPIYQHLTAALFQDAGVLMNDNIFSSVRDGWVAATGFGLRYNTPIGPLRGDLGFRWKKLHEKDSRISWYLTLGHAF